MSTELTKTIENIVKRVSNTILSTVREIDTEITTLLTETLLKRINRKATVKIRDQKLILEFELPGIPKENIKITFEKRGDEVAIRVEGKGEDREITEEVLLPAEQIPPIQELRNMLKEGKIETQYNNGLLRITIPTRQQTTKEEEKIEVQLR